ncbi:uncharacterized protein LOC135849954 [Planococcus citri]|uniref:uncharacterized protein LOC135849954 n=1 Tax=Planococcus citri TaxID=170843 RepID=UPI0031F9706A
MDKPPLLPYHPEVDTYGSRTLETESGQIITFDEAFHNAEYVKKALDRESEDVPIEFTMFVLRKMAVKEKDFRSFQAALPPQAYEYLEKLIGSDACHMNQVHSKSTYKNGKPSSFRGALTKIFCKKVICNVAKNQKDAHYDRLAAIFPFKVSKDVPKGELKIFEKFDDDFYAEVQFFLNRHFENVDARKMSELFLLNIWNFRLKYFPAKLLLERLENPGVQHDDYLSKFPRLHPGGVDQFKFLYREFTNAMKENEIYENCDKYFQTLPETCYAFADLYSFFVEDCDDEYFQTLPEKNFEDLYSFFEHENFFDNNRSVYMRRFRKYLFFFVHALSMHPIPNPVFFIDDLLFECLKSLRRYKTCEEYVFMRDDLTRITILHYRMDLDRSESCGQYYLNNDTLERIKNYILKSVVGGDPATKNPQLNVKYKTDLLTWMPFRTDDDCFNVCYSSNCEYETRIKDFLERVLCSVLCPDNEPVKCIVGYNAFKGIELRYYLPNDIESLRNFIRLCSTCDVTNEPLNDPNNVYIWKTFRKFIETECKRSTIIEDDE